MTEQRPLYACISNERWSMKVGSSDGSTTYDVEYYPVYRRARDIIQWRFTCTCKGYRVHKRTCKHIKEAKLHYCGWQERNHEKPLENYDPASGEGTCPLCGRLARPMDELKNLHPEILL